MKEELSEITEIKNCIIAASKNGNIHIECKEPMKELIIEENDVKLISGVSDILCEIKKEKSKLN